MKQVLIKMILANKTASKLFNKIRNKKFPGSAVYWENRYSNNGNSGQGSYGNAAIYKSTFLNDFVKSKRIESVLEFGSGDGNQLNQFRFPCFIGLDVSQQAIKKCIEMYKDDKSKSFFLYDPFCFTDNSRIFSADLCLSLDVVYHLVEDIVFETYMRHLFAAATRYVIIYAWDTEGESKFHVKNRKFTNWIDKNITDFKLFEVVPNRTNEPVCDFYIYKRL